MMTPHLLRATYSTKLVIVFKTLPLFSDKHTACEMRSLTHELCHESAHESALEDQIVHENVHRMPTKAAVVGVKCSAGPHEDFHESVHGKLDIAHEHVHESVNVRVCGGQFSHVMLVDVSDIFYFSAPGRGRESPRRQEGGGGCFFF